MLIAIVAMKQIESHNKPCLCALNSIVSSNEQLERSDVSLVQIQIHTVFWMLSMMCQGSPKSFPLNGSAV